MNRKLKKEEHRLNKVAANSFANRHWWGKYTLPMHLAQAFLAGINYQRQKNENNKPSEEGIK